VRYAGQAYELTVPVADPVDGGALSVAAERFHERHRERFGHANPGEPLELVGLRLRARGLVDPPTLRAPAGADTLADARRETRRVAWADGAGETPVYERDRLPAEGTLDGPAVVEGCETTILVPPDATARVDGRGTLVLEVA